LTFSLAYNIIYSSSHPGHISILPLDGRELNYFIPPPLGEEGLSHLISSPLRGEDLSCIVSTLLYRIKVGVR